MDVELAIANFADLASFGVRVLCRVETRLNLTKLANLVAAEFTKGN